MPDIFACVNNVKLFRITGQSYYILNVFNYSDILYTNISLRSLGGFFTGFHPDTGFVLLTIIPRTQKDKVTFARLVSYKYEHKKWELYETIHTAFAQLITIIAQRKSCTIRIQRLIYILATQNLKRLLSLKYLRFCILPLFLALYLNSFLEGNSRILLLVT